MNITHSHKEIQSLKESLEKDHGREFTWEEAVRAMKDLDKFVRITWNITTEEFKRRDLLKQFPQGFHLEGGGKCLICKASVSKENS